MADKEAERLKFETEVLRFTSLLMVGAGGGSIRIQRLSEQLEKL